LLVYFNRTFEAGPFGGSQQEYEVTFKNAFDLITLETSINSIVHVVILSCFEFKKTALLKSIFTSLKESLAVVA
jgi:hypothetical protein